MGLRPAWGTDAGQADDLLVDVQGIDGITPEWAWGRSTGDGVRVCLLDSGVEAGHPLVGPVQGCFAAVRTASGIRVEPVVAEDLSGHGTACASVLRQAAPGCELHSVRVLGGDFTGTGEMLLAGLRWAVDQRYDIINLSLSTARADIRGALQEIVDDAVFHGTAVIASAHNADIASYPWRFSAVLSVAGHAVEDPGLVLVNPDPPVEFFAQGSNVRVAWLGGSTRRTTGNSFAAPRVAGLAARILAKHPLLTVSQLRAIMTQTAGNARPR